MPSHTPSERLKNVGKSRRRRVFREVFKNTPSTVDTSKSAAGQRKQKTAIALSKLRKGRT